MVYTSMPKLIQAIGITSLCGHVSRTIRSMLKTRHLAMFISKDYGM